MFLYANGKIHREVSLSSLKAWDKTELLILISELMSQLRSIESTLDSFIAGELEVSRNIESEVGFGDECCEGGTCCQDIEYCSGFTCCDPSQPEDCPQQCCTTDGSCGLNCEAMGGTVIGYNINLSQCPNCPIGKCPYGNN